MQFSWLTFSTGLRSCWHTFHYGLSSLFFWRSLRVMLSFASEETLRFTDVRFLWAKCPKYSVKAWSYCFARSITFCCSQMVLRCCDVVACNSSSRTIIPGEPNLTQVAVSQRNRLIQWETKNKHRTSSRTAGYKCIHYWLSCGEYCDCWLLSRLQNYCVNECVNALVNQNRVLKINTAKHFDTVLPTFHHKGAGIELYSLLIIR